MLTDDFDFGSDDVADTSHDDDLDFDFGSDGAAEFQQQKQERRYEPEDFRMVPGCQIPITEKWPGVGSPYQDNASWKRGARRVRLDAQPAAFYVPWRGMSYRLPLYTWEQTEHTPFNGVEGETVYRHADQVPETLKSRAAWAREGRRLKATACQHAAFGQAKLYPVEETEPMRRRCAADKALDRGDVPEGVPDLSDFIRSL